jgi:transglutaminase-like putative cysteine protease
VNAYLERTPLLDYESDAIADLIARKRWKDLDERQRIARIYDFVRDEIPFGYNERDELPASRILAEGYGQCNTKAVLFMALLRAVGIPCRIHGFTIDKELQRGAIGGIWYALTPARLVHSWVELSCGDAWLDAEGIILDKEYLGSLQERYEDCTGAFCGYGVATKSLRDPGIDWNGKSTYIQSEGIREDLGVFESPDAFFAEHAQKIGFLRHFLFAHLIRHSINRNVAKIRRQRS